MSSSAKKITLEDLQQIIKDLGESHKMAQEAAAQKAAQPLRRITRELKEAQKAAQEAQKETGREHKELHRKFKIEQQKTEEAIRRVSESLDKASGNFNNKWGMFMENLVKGDLVRLLNERDIQVVKTLSRVPFYRSKGEQEGEFDLIAVNGEEVVIVEVKTTLMPSHVDYFIEKLKQFRNVFPEYSDKRIYGSIAYLDDNNMGANYAKDKGLFVIKAPGGESRVSMITNASDFTPKLF